MTRNLRWIYFGWLALTVVAIVLQFYLAGYGVFAFKGLPPFDPHLLVGDLIGLASLIGIGLAFAARAPWRITGINGAFFVLMIIQAILAHTGVQAISALHVVNGVLIFAVTGYLTRQVWLLASEGGAGAPASAATSAPARM
ncbi:MAG TPA: DUF6220 domain-containing protein [Candidatus Dormibacteraeota bacterium]|nr:DUF6220 domain-containing protein [Candidatus Dormibacteraeota bacterium]